MIIKSWLAFLIYCVLIAGGMVWATFYPSTPYAVFASAFTTAFIGYVGKRLLQKGYNNGNGIENGIREIERGESCSLEELKKKLENREKTNNGGNND